MYVCMYVSFYVGGVANAWLENSTTSAVEKMSCTKPHDNIGYKGTNWLGQMFYTSPFSKGFEFQPSSKLQKEVNKELFFLLKRVFSYYYFMEFSDINTKISLQLMKKNY